MSYWFEWDGNKARLNLEKHGVSLEEAETAFGDPFAAIYPNPLHSEGEKREILVGRSSEGRLLLVSFTERGDAIRIISCRKPTKHERKKYENRG